MKGRRKAAPSRPYWLANVLLDEVDKELEKRGHRFVRYADDLNVYVRSKRAGERVFVWLRRVFARLRLEVNEEKSAVDAAQRRSFLGFSIWYGPGGVVKMRLSPKAKHTFKTRIRQITRRSRGRSLEQIAEDLRNYMMGWRNYFRLAQTPRVFQDLDQWIRHRLRAIQLKQWKRGKTIYRELCKRGLSPSGAREVAANSRRWWRNSRMKIHVALPIKFFDRLGVPRLAR